VAVGPGEVRPAGPTQGVVVDIGDGIGALVLYADADREWMEPEIQPIEDPSARQHVWVLARIVGSGIVYAAVFPSLPEGRYGLCAPGASLRRRSRSWAAPSPRSAGFEVLIGHIVAKGRGPWPPPALSTASHRPLSSATATR